jgi:2-desacetyl-2-hydroxyethyl bacteriochlorophyllide A dehydrogenase
VYFVAPRHVEVRRTLIPEPGRDQVLVQTVCSAISPGTEMLVYRGDFPLEERPNADEIGGHLAYPLPFGYACVGRVVAAGAPATQDWVGRLVFGFRPHCSHFLARPGDLLEVPEGLTAENAAFLPNMETAVNLVQDAAPVLGEAALVLGQGVVGLLATAMLSEFPLAALVTADLHESRRSASAALGADAALDPSAPDFRPAALHQSQAPENGFDLTLELSGNPAALNEAIALTRYSGRIIVGSWFGRKMMPIDLGGTFHRSRIRIVSSQVSTISPDLAGRWTKERRFQVAWDALSRIRPAQWISHRFRIEDAAEAYQLLDQSPEKALQVVFDY